MVRPSDRRQKKFEAKVDAEVLARQTRALKPLMVMGQSVYFPDIAAVESKVKTLVEAQAVTSLQVRDYLNFGREMYRLSKRFSSTTLNAEAQVRVDKWVSRGLDGSLLVKTAQLFGVTPTALPTPPALPSMRPLIWEYRPLYWYKSAWAIGNFNKTTSIWSNSVLAQGFPLTRKVRLAQMGMFLYKTGLAGESMRLGLYNSNAAAYPKNLLASSPPLSFPGPLSEVFDIDLTLEPGLFFLAWFTDSDTVETYYSDLCFAGLGSENLPDLIPITAYGYDMPYGEFPDPFPSPPLYTDAVVYALALSIAEVF